MTSPRLATPRSGSVLGVINCFLALCSNSWLSKPRGPSRAFIGEPMQQSVHGRLDGAPHRKSRETCAPSPARCVRNIQSSVEPFRLLHRSSSGPFHVRRSGVVAVAFSPFGKRRPPLTSGFAGVGDEDAECRRHGLHPAGNCHSAHDGGPLGLRALEICPEQSRCCASSTADTPDGWSRRLGEVERRVVGSVIWFPVTATSVFRG